MIRHGILKWPRYPKAIRLGDCYKVYSADLAAIRIAGGTRPLDSLLLFSTWAYPIYSGNRIRGTAYLQRDCDATWTVKEVSSRIDPVEKARRAWPPTDGYSCSMVFTTHALPNFVLIRKCSEESKIWIVDRPEMLTGIIRDDGADDPAYDSKAFLAGLQKLLLNNSAAY